MARAIPRGACGPCFHQRGASMSSCLRAILALVVAFVLLQAVDFAFTWKLLGARADVYEANPLARTVLESGGWGGLALFKCAVTALALAAALLVARRRPAASLRLLAGLCLLMLG